MKPLLEIAVFNIDSAIAAAAAGADRIEFCENPADGGTTPSYGSLKKVRDHVKIPVFPIIRPHGGDFLYSKDAFEAMKEDILLCKLLGFEGVVTGMLNRDGSVDEKRTSELVANAYPMQVTFHRAFDRCIDALEALETIINCGCHRILTSGQTPTAPEGKILIKQLVSQAEERIIIMPGSGVRSNNIGDLASFTGAGELHSSARKFVPSDMSFVNSHMQETLQNITADKEEIKNMQAALKSFAAGNA